jgi:hypothetical protein
LRRFDFLQLVRSEYRHRFTAYEVVDEQLGPGFEGGRRRVLPG